MVLATHTTSTSCISRCTCGADLANEVHYAKEEVETTDKKLIELRNSGAPEEEIQQAEEARHAAQQRYDEAFKNLVDDTNEKESRIAHVDDEEAVLSDDDGAPEDSEDDADDEDDEEESEEDLGTVSMLAGGDVDGDDDDDEDDEDYKPE